MAGRWSPTDPPPAATNRNRGEFFGPRFSIHANLLQRNDKVLSLRTRFEFHWVEIAIVSSYIHIEYRRPFRAFLANSGSGVPAKKKDEPTGEGKGQRQRGGRARSSLCRHASPSKVPGNASNAIYRVSLSVPAFRRVANSCCTRRIGQNYFSLPCFLSRADFHQTVPVFLVIFFKTRVTRVKGIL